MSCLTYPNNIIQQQHCCPDREKIYQDVDDKVVTQHSSCCCRCHQQKPMNNDDDNNKIPLSELSFGPITKDNIEEVRYSNGCSMCVCVSNFRCIILSLRK
jgi:hypothetical protein